MERVSEIGKTPLGGIAAVIGGLTTGPVVKWLKMYVTVVPAGPLMVPVKLTLTGQFAVSGLGPTSENVVLTAALAGRPNAPVKQTIASAKRLKRNMTGCNMM
jgi:hypothetical protein